MTLLGVDVSEWQGRPNWGQVAAAGVTFAFARVCYGSDHLDTSYGWNRKGIPGAGLVPGGYHFLTTAPVAAQADAFCAAVDPLAMHALDVEVRGVDVPGWVARYRHHFPDHPLVIYTGRDLWRQGTGGMLNGATLGCLWLAGYQPNAYVPGGGGALAALWSRVGSADGALPWGGWRAPTFMQFTDSAQVPGISGGVDGDAFLGSLDDLHALTGEDMALSDADKQWVITAITQGVNACLAAHEPWVRNKYPVVLPDGTHVPIEQGVAWVAGYVAALTPTAIAHAAATGAAADPVALATEVAKALDVRQQVVDVLRKGTDAAGS